MSLKQVTKILLDQALPRLTPPEDYVLLDALGNDERRRFSRRRYRYRTGFRRSSYRLFGRFSGHHFPDLDGAFAGPAQPAA
jgi:hypothetical protein